MSKMKYLLFKIKMNMIILFIFTFILRILFIPEMLLQKKIVKKNKKFLKPKMNGRI